jgi:hypothetical protein
VEAHARPELPGRRRHLAVDEQGAGLRATWHPERGFVNLSLWRGDACVETFHLTPVEASRLVGFLVERLAGAVPEPEPPAPPALTLAPLPAPSDTRRSRRQLAEALERTAARLRR